MVLILYILSLLALIMLIDKPLPCSPAARKRAGFLNSSLELLAVYERSEQASQLSTSHHQT
jgi:hypothetical protein